MSEEHFFALGARIVGSVVELLKLWQVKTDMAHGTVTGAQPDEARRFGMLVRTKMFTFFVVRQLTLQGLLPGAGEITVRISDDALPVALQEALDRQQPEDLDAEP